MMFRWLWGHPLFAFSVSLRSLQGAPHIPEGLPEAPVYGDVGRSGA